MDMSLPPDSTLSLGAIDEVTLRRLAAEPRRELFPVLSHARAMRPLILLVAVIPSLFAATRYMLSESNAWQGLAALRVYQAESSGMLIDPARGSALDGQPPLSSWLTALAMFPFGPASTAAMTAATCLGVAVLVYSAALLARRCGGERAALIAAICLSVNPAVMRQTLHPGPAPLGAGLAALALVALVEHWQRANTRWSPHLLWGGVALGASVLCAPVVPLIAMVLALVSAIVSAVWSRAAPRESPGDSWYPADCQQFTRITAVVRWGCLGMLVGGWWPLLKTTVDGPEFWWRAWSFELRNTAVEFSEVGGTPIRYHSEGLLVMIWPIVGLIMLGVVGVLANNLPGRRPDRPGRRGFLLVGLSATALAGLVWQQWGPPITGGEAAIQLLLLIPPSVFAAIGFLRVVDRQVSVEQAVAALAGSAIAGGLCWWLLRPEIGSGESVLPRLGVGIALTGGILLMTWIALGLLILWRTAAGLKDLPRRCALIGGLSLMLVLAAIWGVSSVGRTRVADRDFTELRQSLRQIGERSQIVLLSPDASAPAPAELEFLVRAFWPRAETHREPVWPPSNEAQQLLAEEPPEPGEFLLVTWSAPGGVRASVSTHQLRPVGTALRFRKGEVAKFEFGELELSR